MIDAAALERRRPRERGDPAVFASPTTLGSRFRGNDAGELTIPVLPPDRNSPCRSSPALLSRLASLLVAAPLFAATFAGVDVPAPPPPKNVTETYFGTSVDDPYRFLEEVKDPAVVAWMKSQADAATAILAKLPGRDPLLARIQEIESKAAGLTDRAVRAASGRYFFLKRDPADNQFRLVYRDTADGPERLIVDPEALDDEDRDAALDHGFCTVG